MSTLLNLVPLALSGVVWYAFSRLNRRRGWFRIGEVIFWDAIILVLIYLAWLHWF